MLLKYLYSTSVNQGCFHCELIVKKNMVKRSEGEGGLFYFQFIYTCDPDTITMTTQQQPPVQFRQYFVPRNLEA